MKTSLSNRNQAMLETSIEISIKGNWVRVPASHIAGQTIAVQGTWLRMAAIHDEEWLDTELEDPELCVKQLRNRPLHGLHADIFTFSRKPAASFPTYPYHMEPDSIAAIRLASFKEWWEKLPQETRKNVRRSQKRGVVVSIRGFDDELVRGIVTVNNDSPVRQGQPNAHYGKSFQQVKRDHSAFLDRSDFICAYLGDEMIGYAKVVYRGEVASILNFAPKTSHSDKRPANALLAKVVEACAARGVGYVTYGKFNYGNKRDTPLREFKERNGFGEMLVPRFYVPLTRWGALCMKLGLHRGLLGVLPHGIITLGAKARSKWYGLTNSTSRCSSMPERPNSTRQMECSNPPAGSNDCPNGTNFL